MILRRLGNKTKIATDEKLFKHWGKNKETEPIQKAVRFLLLSNFGFLGKPETLKFSSENTKKTILKKFEKTIEFITKDCTFMNNDFRNVIDKIQFRPAERGRERAFIYCDPPYLGTSDNYSNSFTEKDLRDLFDVLLDSKIKFAVSEFDNDVVLEIAKENNLIVNLIGERKNILNRRTEILVTNYKTQNLKLF